MGKKNIVEMQINATKRGLPGRNGVPQRIAGCEGAVEAAAILAFMGRRVPFVSQGRPASHPKARSSSRACGALAPRPSPRPAASHLCCLSSRGASSCWRLPAPSSFPLWGPDSQARPAAQRDPPAPGPLLLLRTRGQAGSLGNPRASQLTVCKHRTEGNNEDRGAFWSADLSI